MLFCTSEVLLPASDPSVYPTAARPGFPAGGALSHDREQSEDVPQANQAARETVSPDDTGGHHPKQYVSLLWLKQ